MITVNRTNGSERFIPVQCSSSNGTANSTSDYQSANGTIDFAAGETYMVSVSAKNYSFDQNSQIRNVVGDTQNINFTADAKVSPKLDE